MPNLVGTDTFDTLNDDGTCIYPAKALGGTPNRSANIRINQQVCEFYDVTSPLDPVEGQKINPLSPLPCQPGTRTIVAQTNTSVFFNGKLPAVTGDKTQMLFGSPRILTGPYKAVNIIIGQNL